MAENVPCQSYVWGSGVCRDGFPVSPICTGRAQCFGCGRWSDRLPACQREDLGPQWIDDRGLPIYAQHRRPAAPQGQKTERS
jgi:hypothetical protein